jgi:hypothetical protein
METEEKAMVGGIPAKKSEMWACLVSVKRRRLAKAELAGPIRLKLYYFDCWHRGMQMVEGCPFAISLIIHLLFCV